jgi:hypothetical protein
MTIKELLETAVRGRSPGAAARAVDALRARGLTYRRTFELARELTGIDEAAWEALLYEAEWEEGYGA